MGIFSRSKDIFSANARPKKSKAAAMMVNEYLLDATEDFEESKKELETLEAEESRYKRILDEANSGLQKYAELARRAVQAGNDGDARVFIKQKQLIEGNIEAARKAYEAARENACKMRKMHNKIAADIETLKALKAQMEGTDPGAETQKEAGNLGAAFAVPSRMEEKPQVAPNASSAMAELNAAPSDPAEDLEKKYGKGGKSSVENELKATQS